MLNTETSLFQIKASRIILFSRGDINLKDMKSRHAPPRASAMIEALRGLGYNTATALADIIDNSITANAKNIHLRFIWQGSNSQVVIQDDGSGMSAKEIDTAMRLGEKSPLDTRASGDLGRFGLGLKTASFSQCRRLTVASIGIDGLQCLRWDLDVIATSLDDGWHLLEGPASGSESLLDPLKELGCGTLVAWEVLDRVVTANYREQDFLDLIDRVENHLAMVFHRYLEKSSDPIRIFINDNAVSPWDPFLCGHPAKPWHSPSARTTKAAGVQAECHVLPHKDRLTEKEFLSAQGPDGWTAQQGFYVYRNERLLLAGSWLGLGQGRAWTKDEAHRLARIRLDIPNSADEEWKIDIRKSVARPPIALRSWLVRLAEDTRARARRSFAHRGRIPKTQNGEQVVQAWQAHQTSGGIRYKIDLDHQAVRAVIDDAGTLYPQIRAMLRVIEETVPIQRIWLDTAENKETPRTGFSGEPSSEVTKVLEVMYRNMVVIKGMSPAMARERLMRSEPFNSYPDLVAALPDQA